MRTGWRWLALLLLLLPAGVANAAGPQRIALIIANSEYSTKEIPGLRGARNDAAMLAPKLRRAGFGRVTVAENLTKADMEAALRKFAARARHADYALVYFAGHSHAEGDASYLVPADATKELAQTGVPTAELIDSVRGARRLRLAILDASNIPDLSAAMSARPGRQVLVATAAGPGQLALEAVLPADGDPSHSLFAFAFAREMRRGRTLGAMLDSSGAWVAQNSGGHQKPAVYGDLAQERLLFMRAHHRRPHHARHPS